MTRTDAAVLDDLTPLLDDSVRSSGVPAASVAVLHRGSIHAAASGVANARAGIEATPDTVFQIGSVTKSFTATLIMQLVETGLMQLEDSLAQHLPELELAEPDRAKDITVLQLLSHTNGIDGDQMIDTGRGDDCLEKFVEACAGIELIHPPGAFFSYSNAGYIFLGRMIEKLSDKCWDDVLKARLLEPLGLSHAGTLAEDLVLERFAAGHSVNEAGEYELEPLWMRSNGPSGSRTFMTATELVTFAGMHMAGGLSADGERLLKPAGIGRMQTRAVEIPLSARYTAWGLGWMHFDWSGQRVFGHDGGVAGTSTFLRLLPEHDLAIALMTNGAAYKQVFEKVVGVLVAELADIGQLPGLPAAAEDADIDLACYAGLYERRGLSLQVTLEDGRLMGLPGGEYGETNPAAFEIQCIDRQRFRGRLPGIGVDVGIYFLDFYASQKGLSRPRYLHYLERAFRRSPG